MSDVDLHRGNGKRTKRDDDTPHRLPPNDFQSECDLLGCILYPSKEALAEAMSRVTTPDIFFDLKARTVWETILEMAQDDIPVDVSTLQARLRAFGQLESLGGGHFISTLPDGIPGPANALYYINLLLELFQKRRMLQLCTEFSQRVYEHQGEGSELLDQWEAEALKVRVQEGQTATANCRQDVFRVMEQIQHYHERPGELSGMSTGFKDLDHFCDGFQGSDMIVVAGLTSGGKTALALNFVEHVAIDLKEPCAIFSLEMRKHRLLTRIISSRAGVSVKAVRRGEVDSDGISKLTTAARHVAAAPVFIDDQPNLTITQIRARARRLHQQFGIKLFVVDYLQLLESTRRKGDSREQEVADVSKGIKAMAGELNVPVIALAQLNREFERDKHRKPRLSDLRESARIGQDSDLVLMLYSVAKEEDDQNDEIPVNLFIAKQRDGIAGVDVKLLFKKSTTRYLPVSKIDANDLPVQEPSTPYKDQ